MDRLRRVTTTAETADSRHTGVVPSVHQSFFYQRQQVTFAHQRVAQVQFVELSLTGTGSTPQKRLHREMYRMQEG